MLVTSPSPIVVAIEMGYGHLRPAHALATELGRDVLEVDRAPLAGPEEQQLWAQTRHLYEGLTRLSQMPALGWPFARLLDTITSIPHLHPVRDLSATTSGLRVLDWLIQRGLGRGLKETLEGGAQALLTTFFAPAHIGDRCRRGDVACVVTDSDINRIWAPIDPASSRIRYFAPSRRVVRRLRSYGVRPDAIVYSGFPLPSELIGGPQRIQLHANLAARLARLDRDALFVGPNRLEIERRIGPLPRAERPPLVTFAVGGAGAQAELAEQFLPSLRDPIRAGRLRLALVAGVRHEVAGRFRNILDRLELDVPILLEPNIPAYIQAFNRLLAETDILWTKPSEISFFAALGLPLVLSRPVGVHEDYNRRWVIESGAGLPQGDPRYAAGWLQDWIADGTLAAAAWSGATRLPNLGLYTIAETVRNQAAKVY